MSSIKLNSDISYYFSLLVGLPLQKEAQLKCNLCTYEPLEMKNNNHYKFHNDFIFHLNQMLQVIILYNVRMFIFTYIYEGFSCSVYSDVMIKGTIITV